MTIIIYYKKKASGRPEYKPLYRPDGAIVGWTRVALSACADLGEALAEARPRRGEVVLNTVRTA